MPALTFDAYGYAREILLPHLGLSNHPFVVKSAGRGGTASRVARIVVERGPDLLVRAFRSRGRARRNAAALRLLEARGLPAPRLQMDDTSPANLFLRTGGRPRWLTTETWIDGIQAVDVPAGDVEATALKVADVLARYHAVTRRSWGRPGLLPDPRPYHAHVYARIHKMLRDLVNRGILKGTTADQARARYGDWRASLMKVGTFQLVHRDANRRNFIVPAGKKAEGVIPIDLHRLAFGVAAEDVADALHHFCRSDAALGRRFLEHYLDQASPSSRTSWDRTGQLFIALNALKRLHKRTDRKAPDRIRSGEPRLNQWIEQAITLPEPPLIWPEPGSSPPAREAAAA